MAALVFKFLTDCETQLLNQVLTEVYIGNLFVVKDHQNFLVVLICNAIIAETERFQTG